MKHREEVLRVAARLGLGRVFQEAEVLDHLPRHDRAAVRAVLRMAVQDGHLRRHLGFYSVALRPRDPEHG